MASIEVDPVIQQEETAETSQQLVKESEGESVGEDPTLKGGFECEFVKKPPDVLQTDCPVCLQILREPHQVTCCGKSYCKVCIEKIKENNNACPTCKEERIQDFPNKGLQQPLYKFKVRCTHQKEGCEWTGELGELDNHLNLDPQPDQELQGCDYAEISCHYKYAGCSTKLTRLKMESHLKGKIQHHLSLLEKRYKLKSDEHDRAMIQILTLQEELATKDDYWLKRIQNHFQIPPVTLTMKYFGYHKEYGKEWFSSPFYTDFRGYKLCLRVIVGYAHLCVEMCLMKGEFDIVQKWPFEQEVEVEVVSQDDAVANKKVVIYHKISCVRGTYWRNPKIPECVEKVTQGEKSEHFIGTQASKQLIKISEVDKFVTNDCIEFHITYAGPYREHVASRQEPYKMT